MPGVRQMAGLGPIHPPIARDPGRASWGMTSEIRPKPARSTLVVVGEAATARRHEPLDERLLGALPAAARVLELRAGSDALQRAYLGRRPECDWRVLPIAVDGRVDAAVDLSGPDEWRDAVVHRHAPGVRAPLLVVMADDEGPEAVAVARDTAQAARSGEFVGAERGHGYELLTDASSGDPSPLAERVLAWIASP